MITMISCPNFENPKLKTGENPFAELPRADFVAFFPLPVDAPTENIGAQTVNAPARNDFQKNVEIEETENLPNALQLKTEPESAQLRIVTASPETQLPQIFPSMIISNQSQPDSLLIVSAGLIDKTETLLKNDFEISPASVSKLDEEIENFDFSPADSPNSEIVETKENPDEFCETKIPQTNEQTDEQIKENNEISNDLPNFFVAISKVFRAENNSTAEQEIQTPFTETPPAQNVPQSIYTVQTDANFQPENTAEINLENAAENKTFFSTEPEMLINNGIETGLIQILETPKHTKVNDLTSFDLSELTISQKKEREEFSNRLPDFFAAMASVFKRENSAAPEITDISPDVCVDFNPADNLSGEPQSVGKIELKFAESGAMNLNQPEKNVPDGENSSLDSEDVAPLNFNKFAATLTKEPPGVENKAPLPVKTREVLTQVEPQMVYLASLTVKENEKKVMKMRLHPAELGMVEITLERDNAGNLNAHFQTESEAARRILTESINDLRQTLRDSGWQIEQMEITCAAFSSNEGNEGGGRGRQANEFQNAENQMNGAASFADHSDNSANDNNDFQRNQSNRFVSLRA